MKKEIVIVEWTDVTKKTNDDAFDENCNIDTRLSKMKTIGMLYQQSEKAIMLVQEFDEDGNPSPRDWVVIPRVLITKMTSAKE
jgi:hypothetical protein